MYDLRRGLWQLSTIDRCRRCGRVVVGQHVAVKVGEFGPGFGGLETCGSVWACPVCARKIAAERQREIGAALGAWQDRGGSFVFLTLTMRHHAGHRLQQEIDSLTTAWASVNVSRVWRKRRDRLGSPGWLRVLEITWSPANGWHAHLHFVLLVAGSTSAADVSDLRGWLFPKWSRAVLAAGMPAPLAVGQDAHLVDGSTAAADLGEYLSKPGSSDPARDLGRELTAGASKLARSEHSTLPAWSIPTRFLETGDAELLDRWGEYERATFRRRQLIWSRGLRNLLAVGEEKTDDEIVADSAVDQVLVFITREGWRTALGMAEPTSAVLRAAEGGSEPLRAFLDVQGIEYVTELSDPTARGDR